MTVYSVLVLDREYIGACNLRNQKNPAYELLHFWTYIGQPINWNGEW